MIQKWRCGRFRLRKWLGGLALLGVVATVGAHLFSNQLLCVKSTLQQADAIVVLGGERRVRLSAAAGLITNRFAPHLIISGSANSESDCRFLEQFGVRTNMITAESASKTTEENARFTVELLRKGSCKRVILVTSWYHSRRALNAFRHYAPEIHFISAPAPRVKSWRSEWKYVTAEYIMTLWYALRYRIWPVTFD